MGTCSPKGGGKSAKLIHYSLLHSLLFSAASVPRPQSGEQTAQADAHRPQVGDLVDFDLGVDSAALLQDGPDLVAGDGVHAAAEGHQLHQVYPLIFAVHHVFAAAYSRAW